MKAVLTDTRVKPVMEEEGEGEVAGSSEVESEDVPADPALRGVSQDLLERVRLSRGNVHS